MKVTKTKTKATNAQLLLISFLVIGAHLGRQMKKLLLQTDNKMSPPFYSRARAHRRGSCDTHDAEQIHPHPI